MYGKEWIDVAANTWNSLNHKFVARCAIVTFFFTLFLTYAQPKTTTQGSIVILSSNYTFQACKAEYEENAR